MNVFSLSQYASALEGTGRKVKMTGGNLLSQCLAHTDKNPSMQVFPDGWCNCLAGCDRFHISHYFDEFKDPDWKPERAEYKSPSKSQYKSNQPNMAKPIAPITNEEKPKETYTKYDLFQLWSTLRPLDRAYNLKGIPVEVLDELGWRWSDGVQGMGVGVFIPYFDKSRLKIPFAQVRHTTGDRRFTMLPGAEMITLGKWNLHDGEKIFIVEGPSDAAILEMCWVPWISIPSAANGALLERAAQYCLKHHIVMIYAGDNDEAGDKLRQALDRIAPYYVCQPPKKYKDWGDYYEAEGLEPVAARLNAKYMEEQVEPMEELVNEIFPRKAYIPPSQR